MKLLFFDCETSGLPLDYKASYTEVNNWPRVISLAWCLADLDGVIHDQQHHLIKPDGWKVPTEKFWIENGYSQEESMANGVPIAGVMEAFMAAKMQADVLVAHNLNFDHRIVWAEFIRNGMQPRSGIMKICTMMSTTKFCAIPQVGRGGFKWPKLEELHFKVFGKSFEGAHDALADVLAMKACFYELLKQGVISIPNPENV